METQTRTVSVAVDKDMMACAERSKQFCRYALENVYLTRSENDRSYIVATDGRCLSAVETDGVNDTGRLVPREIVPTRKSGTNVEWDGAQWHNRMAHQYAGAVEGSYPKVVDILPEDIADRVAIRLNATLLARIQTAIGTADHDNVCLFIGAPTDMIYVLGSRGIGLLCPVTTDDRETGQFKERLATLRGLLTEPEKPAQGGDIESTDME